MSYKEGYMVDPREQASYRNHTTSLADAKYDPSSEQQATMLEKMNSTADIFIQRLNDMFIRLNSKNDSLLGIEPRQDSSSEKDSEPSGMVNKIALKNDRIDHIMSLIDREIDRYERV